MPKMSPLRQNSPPNPLKIGKIWPKNPGWCWYIEVTKTLVSCRESHSPGLSTSTNTPAHRPPLSGSACSVGSAGAGGLNIRHVLNKPLHHALSRDSTPSGEQRRSQDKYYTQFGVWRYFCIVMLIFGLQTRADLGKFEGKKCLEIFPSDPFFTFLYMSDHFEYKKS